MQRTSLKERILDFTEARLWEQGYRGLRVDELARDVGISKRTLYEQFRTKEEMAHDALERRLQTLRCNIETILRSSDDEAQQLREIVHQVTSVFANAKGPFFRDLETTPALVQLVDASHAHSHAKLEAVIAAGAASGRFKRDADPHMTRRIVLAAVEGISKVETEPTARERASTAAVELILDGLLAPSSA